MKRFFILALAFTMLAALSGIPASATHEATPITITVQSTYAGLCGTKPGPTAVPTDWTASLQANDTQAPANAKVPTDLWKKADGSLLGENSGPCDYGTDAIWNVFGQKPDQFPLGRGTANCNNVIRVAGADGCVGIHYPSFGPPVQPGRFLNYAKHAVDLPDPRNTCLFVSTDVPNLGTCRSLAVGYTFAVDNPTTPSADDPLEGSYCGTSRGFGWAFAIGTPSIAGQPTEKTWSIVEWTPSSAGSLLPLSGVITGANWLPNTHYKGWTGTPGMPSMRFADGTVKNIYALTSARSYIQQVDVENGEPGLCSGALNGGGVSFFNQSVAIAIGDES